MAGVGSKVDLGSIDTGSLKWYRVGHWLTSFHQDFHGQRLSERVGHWIIASSFVVGTLYGWMIQNLQWALYAWLAGLAAADVVQPVLLPRF